VSKYDGTICNDCNTEIYQDKCNCDYYRAHPEATLPENETSREIGRRIREDFGDEIAGALK
jgi:hypothetical protein